MERGLHGTRIDTAILAIIGVVMKASSVDAFLLRKRLQSSTLAKPGI